MKGHGNTRLIHGDLKAFGIFDITQSLMMGRKTAQVTILSGHRKGYVYFKSGQIVAATDDSLATGERAAMNVFSWTGGTFTIDFEREAEEVTIKIPTDTLLLEVARNIDEIKRDEGIKEESIEGSAKVEDTLRDRVQEKLKSELNSVFRSVAAKVEPQRARYTRNAFDALLQALVDLQGSALFLRPEQRPKIRAANHFISIKDEIISEDELEGFLGCLLSESESRELREQKETTTFLHVAGCGDFLIHALREHGSLLVTFSAASRPLPTLAEAGCPDFIVDFIGGLREGLVVISGPLGSGKSAVIGAALQQHLRIRDAFAIEFASASSFAYANEFGCCVRRGLPRDPSMLHAAVRSALEQSPDVLAFIGDATKESFALALGAAAAHRLVFFALESHSPSDTLARILRLTRSAEGDTLLEPLSERLHLILDLGMPDHEGFRQITPLVLDRDQRDLLRTGQIDALRRTVISS